MIPYTPGINVSGIRSRELNETKYFLMLQNIPSLDQSLLYIYYNRITGEDCFFLQCCSSPKTQK